MKNYIIILVCIIILFACEKNFETTYFKNSYNYLFKEKNIPESKLVSANQQLLDSLLRYTDTVSVSIDLYCHNDDFLKKTELNNKIQKQELLYWKTCIDSIYKGIDDPRLLHYLYLAEKIKAITKKDLKKRAEAFKSDGKKTFDLAIFFSDDSIYDCYAEYLDKVNLIVIYDYKNTEKYGERDKYLGRALLFFHEIFHADEISQKTLGVVKQHILIDFYEKEIVSFQPEIKEYIQELLTYNLDFLSNQIFVRGTYINHGELAITTLQNYSYDRLYIYKNIANSSLPPPSE